MLHVPADERPGVYKLTASCISFALNGSVTPFDYRPVPVVVRPRSAAPKGQPAEHHNQATPRAAGASRLPELSRVLPGPGQVTFTVASVFKSLGLALFLVMLVGFPAEIFNRTLEENYAEVRRWFRWLGPRNRPASGLRVPPWAQLTAFSLIAAALSTLVDPEIIHREAGWTGKGLLLLIGFVVAIPLTTLVYAVPGESYARRISGERAQFRALPLALVIAVVFVVVSQVGHFLPGYVYGLVAGYGVVEVRKLTAAYEGRAVLIGSAFVLVLSLLAWIVWEPIRVAVDKGHASWLMLALDSTLSIVVILGLEAIVFGLLPMKFLDGGRLRRWNLWAWGVTYATGVFFFVFLLVLDTQPLANTAQHLHAVVTVITLFGAFAVFSIAFWAYFRYRPDTAGETGDEQLDAEPAADQPAPAAADQPAAAAADQPAELSGFEGVGTTDIA